MAHKFIDGPLWISTGTSRTDKSWQKKEMLWSDLIKLFNDVTRTKETIKQYLKMDLDRQGALKDVGGFVGGTISGGRRKKANVNLRSLLTLDVDTADLDLYTDVTLVTDAAFHIYSTHKHTEAAPRYRLVLPLSREVLPDEYEAIARKFADNIGIEQFDPSTFQVERLMYWPSAAKDGLFYSRTHNGPWIDPDEILNQYKDWKDISEWPLHSAELAKVRDGMKDQADPLDKPGLIGAWCRTYTISDVIEKYLSDEYSLAYSADGEDQRYTYEHGSTAAGLVVYDDKFAYSHHGTDPAGGMLCNAFDLVRVHKYGRQDKDYKGVITGAPSYKAMTALVTKDKSISKALGEDRVREAYDVFADVVIEEGTDEELDEVSDTKKKAKGDNLDWLKLLAIDTKGNYQQTIENVIIILQNDIGFKGNLAFNDFTKQYLVRGRLPWMNKKDGRMWNDNDSANLRNYLEKIYGITARTKIEDGLDVTMKHNKFHPVREYLQALVWDGRPRLDSLLIDLFDATDDRYTRAVTRKTLLGAVARIFRPGIKYHTVLTLVGPQGCGKSTWIDRMGRGWASDSFGNIKTKEAVEQIQGVWLVEIGEMAGLKKHEVEEIKHFISKRIDSFRPAYGRFVEEYARQCIFIGTTNNDDVLQDQTGNRRFWPVRVGHGLMNVFEDLTDKYINQVWAEAVKAWEDGEDLHLDKETESLAKQRQAEHTEQDVRKQMVEDYINRKVPDDWYSKNVYQRRDFLQSDEVGFMERNEISVVEIWTECLGSKVETLNNYNSRFIVNIMRNLKGWEYRQVMKNRVRQRLFVRSIPYSAL